MRVKQGTAVVRLADPESVELTLTITLPVHAWRLVLKGEDWNPFREAVNMSLASVDRLGRASVAVES